MGGSMRDIGTALTDELVGYLGKLQHGGATFRMERKAKQRDHSLFHISDTMKCERMRIMQRDGSFKREGHSATSLWNFHMGDLIEQTVLEAFDAAGLIAERQGKVTLGADIKGSFDAIVRHPDDKDALYLIDVKSCDYSKLGWIKRGSGSAAYSGQVTAYRMGIEKDLAGVGLLWVAKNSKGANGTCPVYYEAIDQDKWKPLVEDSNRSLCAAWGRYKESRLLPDEPRMVIEAETKSRGFITASPSTDVVPPWFCWYCDFWINCPTMKARMEETLGRRVNA